MPLRNQRVAVVSSVAVILMLSAPPLVEAQGVLFVTDDRVSIGTDTPTAPLDVDADGSAVGIGNAVVLLRRQGPLAFQLNDESVAGFWNFATAAGETEFRVSRSGTGVVEMTLTEAGDLTVVGDIFTSSCSPCTSDYVFEPGYELLSLAEVKTFIARNGHLPNVPSEAELQEKGSMGLHSAQVKLLEKIEELTLYTLQQQELIEELTTLAQHQVLLNEELRAEFRELRDGSDR